MTSRVRLFVTAAPDLEPEREAIGKAIAQLPVSLGWEIKRTPRRSESLAAALEAVVDCDFYVFLLGTDVTAPVGVEWDTALEASKTPLAFLKDVPHTPAAQAFARFAEMRRVRWTPFGDPQELGILVQETLARRILDRAEAYGLSPVEWETLSALLENQRPEEGQVLEEAVQEPRGAGGGGVILAPGRDLPSGGVLMEETESH
jgi:hypothetical protein